MIVTQYYIFSTNLLKNGHCYQLFTTLAQKVDLCSQNFQSWIMGFRDWESCFKYWFALTTLRGSVNFQCVFPQLGFWVCRSSNLIFYSKMKLSMLCAVKLWPICLQEVCAVHDHDVTDDVSLCAHLFILCILNWLINVFQLANVPHYVTTQKL